MMIEIEETCGHHERGVGSFVLLGKFIVQYRIARRRLIHIVCSKDFLAVICSLFVHEQASTRSKHQVYVACTREAMNICLSLAPLLCPKDY